MEEVGKSPTLGEISSGVSTPISTMSGQSLSSRRSSLKGRTLDVVVSV